MRISLNGFILGCLFLFLFITESFAQERSELEKRMEKTNKEIELTNKMLNENIQKQKTSLNHLLLLKRRINLRESLINDLDIEISLLDKEIYQKLLNIQQLEKDLEKLRAEYAKMIYFAYKNRNNYDKLMFVLSAEDFNQAYRRMKYFEQYSKYRKKQATQIIATRKNLEYEIEGLTEIRLEKKESIEKKEREKKQLIVEQGTKRTAIDRLKNQQEDLKKKLAKAERVRKQLEKAITDLIAKEAEKNSFYKKLDEEESRISSSFLANKGKHSWPVKSCVVVNHFGIHDHIVLKGVKVNNEGIDVRVDNDLSVHSIFDGEVKKVFAIPGANISVIIRHGHYLTVYSNLTNVQVKVGDKVKKGKHIGDVFSGLDTDQSRMLHLRIYEENKKLNPIDWLSKV